MTTTDENNVILSNQSLALLDELSVGAFTVDVNRKVKSMNMSAQALMGLKEKDIIGKDCRDIFTGVPCMVSCLLRSRNSVVTNEPDVEIVNENETKKLLTRMAIPVYDRDHRLAGCLTILQDHSPIADLIDRIHYEERSYKTILNNLDIGIFTKPRRIPHFFQQRSRKNIRVRPPAGAGKALLSIFRRPGSRRHVPVQGTPGKGLD